MIDIVEEKIHYGYIACIYGPATVTYLDDKLRRRSEIVQDEFYPPMVDFLYEFNGPKKIIRGDEYSWDELLDLLDNGLDEFYRHRNALFEKISGDATSDSQYLCIYRMTPWIITNRAKGNLCIDQSFTVLRVEYHDRNN